MTRWTGVLDDLGRRARRLLIGLRLAQWFSVMVLVALLLGGLDWLLGLPGWLRLVIGVSVVASALMWLVTRLRRAVGMRLSRGELALRVERIYPRTRGWLASAVELADQSEGGERAGLAGCAMADRVIAQAESFAGEVRPSRVLYGGLVRRYVFLMLVALGVAAVLFAAAPMSVTTASQRWLMPMGDVQWPSRQSIEDATVERVWPADSAIVLRANVTRGDWLGLRAVARFGEPSLSAGQASDQGRRGWREVGMARQGKDGSANRDSGLYEAVIEVPTWVRRELMSDPGAVVEIGYAMLGGDAATGSRQLKVTRRPEIDSISFHVKPPDYAAGWIEDRVFEWDASRGDFAGLVADALRGSTIRATVRSTKPMDAGSWQGSLGGRLGLVEDENEQRSNVWHSRWVVDDRLEAVLALSDSYGLTSDERVNVLVAVEEDREPTVSMREPSSDTSVLASARVGVVVTARDDVGLAWAEVRATLPAGTDSSAGEDASVLLLGRSEEQANTLTVKADLDLDLYQLLPGQVIEIVGVAQDNYDLNGEQHNAVYSAVRRLRVIDEATLVGELQSNLGAVRRRVLRVAGEQNRLIQAEATTGVTREQSLLTERIEREQQAVTRMQERVESNRLEDSALGELLAEAGSLLEQASDRSARAQASLERATAEAATEEEAKGAEQDARDNQRQASQSLEELADLLDMSGDALTLRLELRALAERQAALEREARKLLSKTLGRQIDELDEETKRRVEDLALRQQQLAEEADQLTRQMQATARSLAGEQADDESMASSMVLREASEIALRQGLMEQMQQAGQEAAQGQMSRATASQASAASTISRMLDAMDQREQRQRDLLERRLAELSEVLRRLIMRQEAHLELVEGAIQNQANLADSQWSDLAEGQGAIRRGTMSASTTAQAGESTAEAVEPIEEAIKEQARAITALRGQDSQDAKEAEAQAIDGLKRALALIEELGQVNEMAEANRQRRELRERYEQMAAAQEALLLRAGRLLSDREAGATRRQRAAVVEMAGEQAELGDEVVEVGQMLGEASGVFTALHEWVEGSIDSASGVMRRGRVDEAVMFAQRDARDGLLALAEALKEPEEDEPFAGGNDGGGGGGGGGGGEAELIPPLAELRAMRATQAAILEQTRVVASMSKDQEARLMALSTLQRRLGELGHELIEKLRSKP